MARPVQQLAALGLATHCLMHELFGYHRQRWAVEPAVVLPLGTPRDGPILAWP